MPREYLEIQVTVDDETRGGFQRLEQRLRGLETTVTRLSQRQLGATRENVRLQEESASRARRMFTEDQRVRLQSAENTRERLMRADRESVQRHRREVSQQRRLRREVDRTGESVRRAFSQSVGRGGLLSFVEAIDNATNAFAGLGLAITAVGARIISASSEFDRLNRGLVAVTGNASNAREQLQQIQELSRLPGITFQGAARSALRLRASGFGEDTTTRVIREFGNLATSSGATAADANEAIRQLTQIASTQRFTSENLNVILERLPGARGVFLREFGTTVGGDIQKLLEAQGQTFEDALERILTGAERLPRVTADSFDNALSNLGNDLNALAREIGVRLLPALTKLVDGIAALVRFFTTDFGQTLLNVGGASLVARGAQVAGGAVFGGSVVGGAASNVDRQTRARARSRQRAAQSPGIEARVLNVQADRARILRQEASVRQISATRIAGGLPTTGARAVTGAAAGVLGGPWGIALGASAGFAYDQWSRYSERVAENTQRIADELNRVNQNFNERVFGGDEGLGKLKQFDDSLVEVQKSLGDILEVVASDSFAGHFDRIRREFTENLPESADELGLYLLRTTEQLGSHFEQSVQFVTNLLNRLDVSTLNVTQIRQLTPLVGRLFETSESNLRDARTRRTEIEQELRASQQTIDRLRRDVSRSAPRQVGRGRITEFPQLEGIDNVQEFHERSQRELEAAIARRNEAEVGLANLRERIDEQAKENELLQENVDLLTELQRLRGEADPQNRLLRARTQLERAAFDERRVTTFEESEAVRNQIQAANNAIRDAAIEQARLREEGLEISERDQVRFQATVAQLNQTARLANLQAEEEHQQRLRTLWEERARINQRLTDESTAHVYGLIEAHRMQRKAIEDTNKAIERSGMVIGDWRERIRNFFSDVTFKAEAAGRSFQDMVTQYEVAQTVRNMAGVRAGLRRDPNTESAVSTRRVYRNLSLSRLIQSAVGGLGEDNVGTRRPLSPEESGLLRAQRARDAEDEQRRLEQQELQQRAQVERFFSSTASRTFDQFGGDLLLDALGIGGRQSDRIRDQLEDLKEDFLQVQAEIREDTTISERDRLDELRQLNENYQDDVRRIEERAEKERSRAWRDWVKTVTLDLGRLIYEQVNLQIAAKATNAIFDALGRSSAAIGGGGGGGAGSAAGGESIFSSIFSLLGGGGAGAGAGSGAGAGAAGSAGVLSGAGAATAATAGVTAAIVATAAVGLIDPLKDVFNSFSFHSAENDMYARTQAQQATRQLFGGQSPSQFGRQSARDLVDNVTAGIASSGARASGGGGGEGEGGMVVMNNNIAMRIGDREIQEMFQQAINMAAENRIATPDGSGVNRDLQNQRLSNIEVTTEGAVRQANDASTQALSAQRETEVNAAAIRKLYEDSKDQISIENPFGRGSGR